MAKATTGRRGATGKTGPRGAAGATGPRGASASKEYILAAVANQFDDIRKQLDQQLIRTGQIQAQLDLQHRETIELRRQLEIIQSLLQHLPTPRPPRTPRAESATRR